MVSQVIEVVEDAAGWAVKLNGQTLGVFVTTVEAVAHARSISSELEREGKRVRIRIFFNKGPDEDG